MADGNAAVEFALNHWPAVELTLMNNSTHTYAPGEFRVAVIAPAPYEVSRGDLAVVTTLPDGSFMHMLPEFGTVFPDAATSLYFNLGARKSIAPVAFPVIIRIFTGAGLRDFPLAFHPVRSDLLPRRENGA